MKEKPVRRWQWTGGEGWWGVELLEHPGRTCCGMIRNIGTKTAALEVAAALNKAYDQGFKDGAMSTLSEGDL